MSADHRRPLFAFLVVASVCAVLIGQGLRTDGVLDFIVGRSATPAAAVAEPVTLEPRSVRPSAPTADSADEVAPRRSRSADDAAAGGQPGRRGPAPQAPDSAQGKGKPAHVHERQPDRGRPKGHRSHARVAGDTIPDQGDGKGGGKGRKGHGHRGQGPAHDSVPDHAQGPRP